MKITLAVLGVSLGLFGGLPAFAQVAAPPSAPAAALSFSVAGSTIGALLDNPAAREVVDKHLPQLGTNPQLQQARGITLKQLQEFAPQLLSAELLALIDADLAKIK